MKDFSDFYFEFENRAANGNFSVEDGDGIFYGICSIYNDILTEASIEIPKESSDGFSYYVKLLNTENEYPLSRYKVLVKRISSLDIEDSSVSYTGKKDPVRYWMGPYETNKEAVLVSRALKNIDIESKVEKWTPMAIKSALEKEEAIPIPKEKKITADTEK